MIAKIFSKTVDKDVQAYYLNCDGRIYFLMQRQYRRSNAEIFNHGVTLDKALGLKNSSSQSVRQVAEKLPALIRSVERENNIAILNRTKKRFGLIA